MRERWIPWRDGVYQVSTLGRVRRVEASKTTPPFFVLKPYLDKVTGYWIVGLRTRSGTRKTWSLHAVVAEAFYGQCPRGLEIDHRDGNRANCAPDNMEYVTHSVNLRRGFARLRKNRIAPGHAKLTFDAVDRIRRMIAAGFTQRELGRIFGVHWTNIGHIYRGKTWRVA